MFAVPRLSSKGTGAAIAAHPIGRAVYGKR
jgi:hypothetical protein